MRWIGCFARGKGLEANTGSVIAGQASGKQLWNDEYRRSCEMSIPGYFMRVAEVDLSKGKVGFIPIEESECRRFIGGSGLGAKLLFERTGLKTDALGPENVLIFMAGPLTGTKAFASDRFEVITKSPLTGIYAESDCGGRWAEAMKRCGIDGVLIGGQAKQPVHLVMDDEGIRIEDGDWLWGKDTYEVDELVKGKLGQKAASVCIGIAGENQVKVASIMTDGRHGRAAGRAGIGAVMGSKRLKAITAMGTKKVPVAREEELSSFVKEWTPKIRESAKDLADYGTSCGIEYMEEVGDFPVKNWLLGNFEKVSEVTGQHMAATILKNRYHCGRCVLGCGRTVEVLSLIHI